MTPDPMSWFEHGVVGFSLIFFVVFVFYWIPKDRRERDVHAKDLQKEFLAALKERDDKFLSAINDRDVRFESNLKELRESNIQSWRELQGLWEKFMDRIAQRYFEGGGK